MGGGVRQGLIWCSGLGGGGDDGQRSNCNGGRERVLEVEERKQREEMSGSLMRERKGEGVGWGGKEESNFVKLSKKNFFIKNLRVI